MLQVRRKYRIRLTMPTSKIKTDIIKAAKRKNLGNILLKLSTICMPPPLMKNELPSVAGFGKASWRDTATGISKHGCGRYGVKSLGRYGVKPFLSNGAGEYRSNGE